MAYENYKLDKEFDKYYWKARRELIELKFKKI